MDQTWCSAVASDDPS